MTARLDLDAIAAEFLNQCPPCDFGLLKPCSCAGRDYRPTMLALVREVERLRAEMADIARQLKTRSECGDTQVHDALARFADKLRAVVDQ